jgi:hypothetical protein
MGCWEIWPKMACPIWPKMAGPIWPGVKPHLSLTPHRQAPITRSPLHAQCIAAALHLPVAGLLQRRCTPLLIHLCLLYRTPTNTFHIAPASAPLGETLAPIWSAHRWPLPAPPPPFCYSKMMSHLLFYLPELHFDGHDYPLLLHYFPSVDSGGTALVGCNPGALDPLLL